MNRQILQWKNVADLEMVLLAHERNKISEAAWDCPIMWTFSPVPACAGEQLCPDVGASFTSEQLLDVTRAVHFHGSDHSVVPLPFPSESGQGIPWHVLAEFETVQAMESITVGLAHRMMAPEYPFVTGINKIPGYYFRVAKGRTDTNKLIPG